MTINKSELRNKFLNSTKIKVVFEEDNFEFVFKKMNVVEARKIRLISEKSDNPFEIELLINQLEEVKGVKFKHILLNEDEIKNYSDEELNAEVGKDFEVLSFFFTLRPDVFEKLFVKLGEMLEEMRKSIDSIKKK